ncbi:FadR/GntR family transcriptional regulator [Actinomadura sp. LOL_016]|uniref:FadR/GntR family transcriptional regulator n=1 Tax=unclassified Actinomadura TaxID=2626254 RepID=UPI003A7F98CA
MANRIKRGSKVAEALAQEIVRDIVARKVPPGTLLPSESEMLEDYGVGRNSLREALRILEVHGIIVMKPGRNGGPMVIDADTRDYGRMSTLFFHLSGATFQQLVDARLVLEPLMARLAAERRGQELVGKLADPDTTEANDDLVYFDATKDFHRTVALMSGNPVLNLISVSLEDIFRDQVSRALSPKEERKHVLEVHVGIAEAIAEGRADDAERLMRDHMKQYADWVHRRRPQLAEEIIDWQ